MKKTKTDWSHTMIIAAIEQARIGDDMALNRFFTDLFQRGKHTLMGLTQNEKEASAYFTEAIMRFKQKFVEEKHELPNKNMEGYIFTMAKFAFYDAQRQKRTIQIDAIDDLTHQVADTSPTKQHYLEEERMLTLQEKAMKEGILSLTKDCQQLFETILKTGEEKSGKLYQLLGWKDARQVTTRKHDCTKQLKVKATMILESMLKEK